MEDLAVKIVMGKITMNHPHAWCPLEPDGAAVIAQMRLEFASYMELMLEAPPVYFRDRYLLQGWALLAGFGLERRHDNTYWVRGWRGNGKEQAQFSQLWVRTGYTGYRDRFEEFYRGMCRQFPHDLRGTDADHVINRARIPENSWVQLFPVPKAANQEYGRRFEQYFPKVGDGTRSIALSPLVCFKLICGKLPSTERELDWAMEDVRGQFLQGIPEIRSYCDQMEQSVRFHMRGDYAAAERANVTIPAGHTSTLDATYAEFRNQLADLGPPLHVVAKEGREELAAVLLYGNEDPNVRLESGGTPLELAAHHGHVRVIEHLLAAGADPNAVRPGGFRPLHLAASNGQARAVRALIAGGANVHAANNRGSTALHFAVQQGHKKAVLALLAAGAEPNVKRADGCSPLHIAAHRDDAGLSRLLLAHGANLDASLADGSTPSDLGDHRWNAMRARCDSMTSS